MNQDMQRRLEQMTAVAEAASGVAPTFHSLAYRNHLLLFIGHISNSLAMCMDLVARPVLVVAITGSAVQHGLISLVRSRRSQSST